jgi:hypothetical protein
MAIDLLLPPVAEYQKRAMFGPERSAVIEATTKAGKTYGCMLWLLEGACNEGMPGAEFWWVAPIFDQTKIAYRRMKRLLIDIDPRGTFWKANESELSIALKNGATMRWKSADKADSLYGEDVRRAVVDEASRCKEDAWYAIRSTLTATRGMVRIIGNVKGRKNWAFQLARKVEAGGLPGWTYAKITARDAVAEGIISGEEVDAARRELPEHVFRELYEAEPSEDGSNPFGLGHIAACVERLGHLRGGDQDKDRRGSASAYGVDLAKSVDWTVVLGLDGDGAVVDFDRWQHEPWDRTQARVLELVGDTPALCDSTGVGDPVVEGMAKNAPNVEGFKFTQTSKQQLMEGLAVAIQRHELAIPDGVLRQELEAFEYVIKDNGRVSYSAPEGFHDDCVCALALAVEKKRRVRPFFFTAIDHAPAPLPRLDAAQAQDAHARAVKERERRFMMGERM